MPALVRMGMDSPVRLPLHTPHGNLTWNAGAIACWPTQGLAILAMPLTHMYTVYRHSCGYGISCSEARTYQGMLRGRHRRVEYDMLSPLFPTLIAKLDTAGPWPRAGVTFQAQEGFVADNPLDATVLISPVVGWPLVNDADVMTWIPILTIETCIMYQAKIDQVEHECSAFYSSHRPLRAGQKLLISRRNASRSNYALTRGTAVH